MGASRACSGISRGHQNWLCAPLAAALMAGCAPGAGPAADWGLDARIGATVEADTNRDLDADAKDSLFMSALNTGLTLTAAMKRAFFAADLDVVGRYFVGEDEEVAGTGRIDPRLALLGRYEGKTYSLTGRASVMARSTEFSQLLFDEAEPGEIPEFPEELPDEFEFTEEDATQIVAAVGASLTRALDSRNAVTLSLDGRQTEYTDDEPGLTPIRTIEGTVGWEHAVSETSTVDLQLGLSHFRADDARELRSQTLDLIAGLTHQRTPRHEFQLRGGVTGVRSVESTGTPEFEIGFTGGAGLDYQLSTLSAGLGLSHSVEPSTTEGDLRTFTRLDGDLRYAINSRESVGASVNYTRRAPLSGDGNVDQLVSLGPSYSVALSPDTRLSLGYLFRVTMNDTEEGARGHRVFLTVSHDISLW